MPIVWLTGITTLVLFAGIAWFIAPLYPGVIMLELAYTPKSFGTIVHAWPAEYLQRYRDFLHFNFPLLISYGAFGYLFASQSPLFSRYPAAWRRLIIWALPVAAAFGAVENALHLWLTAAPRFGVPLVYAVSAACAASKWIIVAAFTLAVLHALSRDEG